MSARLLFPDLGTEDEAAGFLPDIPTLTSAQVLDAVGRRYSMDGFNGMPGRWVFCREVSATTGSYGGQQRFDAVAVGLVPSVKYARVVVEVKVSRSDWLRELVPIIEYHSTRYGTKFRAGRRTKRGLDALRNDPTPLVGEVIVEARKWDAALAISTEFWIAAPPRCVLVSELPPEAGLLEVRLWGKDREPRARVVRAAPVRDTPNPGPEFWAAFLRRAAERRSSPPLPEPI